MTHASVTLSTANGVRYEIDGDRDGRIEDVEFVKVEVVRGKWAFYDESDFKLSASVFLLEEEKEYPLDVEGRFSPLSAKMLPHTTGGITLFEHPNYLGFQKAYEDGSNDITDDFPPSAPRGVSSAIVWPGGKWEVCKGKNMDGLKSEMEAGKYARPDKLPFGGDKIQSLKPLN